MDIYLEMVISPVSELSKRILSILYSVYHSGNNYTRRTIKSLNERFIMIKHLSVLLFAVLMITTAAASAQGPWQPGPYPPPDYYQGGDYGPPQGYYPNERYRGGPARGYYPDNRYRGGPPPRGYRSGWGRNSWDRNSWGRNFFGFPGGGWNDEYGDGPWDMRTFTDPERFWDDMLGTPDYMPTMPGGWNVPSVSVPNPVEVGREIGEQTPEMMDTMRDY